VLSSRFGTLHETDDADTIVLTLVVDATVSTRDRTQSITGSLWLCGKSCGATNPKTMRHARQSRAGLCATHSKVRRQQSQMRWTSILLQSPCVKMTLPRWGQKQSARRIIANAKFYYVAARERTAKAGWGH
jgi:hypothetical protein